MREAVPDRPKRQFVDFSSVPPSQWAMHDRLQNWAAASRGGDKSSGKAAPMFVLYKSGESRREYGAETEVPVDRSDAVVVNTAVGMLPDKHRRAVHWYYVHGGRNAVGIARDLGTTLQALADLVRESRQILINRGV